MPGIEIENDALTGQVTIVTGVGRVIAQTLAAVVAVVAVVARSRGQLDETVALIAEQGGRAVP